MCLKCSELKVAQTNLPLPPIRLHPLLQSLNRQDLSNSRLFPVTLPPRPFLGSFSPSDLEFNMTSLVLLFLWEN